MQAFRSMHDWHPLRATCQLHSAVCAAHAARARPSGARQIHGPLSVGLAAVMSWVLRRTTLHTIISRRRTQSVCGRSLYYPVCLSPPLWSLDGAREASRLNG
jgi:hypothetical protein